MYVFSLWRSEKESNTKRKGKLCDQNCKLRERFWWWKRNEPLTPYRFINGLEVMLSRSSTTQSKRSSRSLSCNRTKGSRKEQQLAALPLLHFTLGELYCIDPRWSSSSLKTFQSICYFQLHPWQSDLSLYRSNPKLTEPVRGSLSKTNSPSNKVWFLISSFAWWGKRRLLTWR